MSPHILRYVRITNSGKLSDRYVTTQVKESSDLDRRAYGRLFCIVEMTAPWHASAQLGQTIINTIAREYFKADAPDPLTRFEEALKKVNETLNHTAKSGDTEWLEQLNAIVVLQVEDSIHLTATGKSYSWLIREGKGTSIMDQPDNTPAPGKTFSAVTSGNLEPGDRMLLTSSGILSVLNETELATNIFAPSELATAAVRLANLLRAKRGQWVNALLLELQSSEALANTPAYALPDTLYLDANSTTNWRLVTRQAFDHSRAGVVAIGTQVGHLGNRLAHLTKTVLWPTTQQLWQQFRAWSVQAGSQIKSKTLPALTRQAAHIRQRATAITAPRTLSAHSTPDTLIGKSLFAINDYQATVDQDHPVVTPSASPPEPELESDLPLERVNHYRLPARLPHTQTRAVRFQLPAALTALLRDTKSLGIGAMVIVLLLLLGSNLLALGKHRTASQSRTAAATQLTELQNSLEQAKLAKIFNQTEKALDAAQSVLTGAQTMKDGPLRDDAHELGAEAQGVIDDLTATTRLTGQEIAQLSGTQLLVWDDHLSVLTEDGTIHSLSTAGGETTTVTSPNGERFSAATALDEADGLAVLTGAPAAYQMNQASGPLTFITPGSGSWNTGIALASFFKSLYVLSPSSNQLWKYPATNGQYEPAQPYVTDGTAVDHGVDLAIDGSVYVLQDSSEIVKFTKGKRVELRVRDIPKPNETLTAPRQIEANLDALFVLADNRIVKLATDGRFQTQYALKDSEPIVSFAIKDKTLFLLTESRLLKADL